MCKTVMTLALHFLQWNLLCEALWYFCQFVEIFASYMVFLSQF